MKYLSELRWGDSLRAARVLKLSSVVNLITSILMAALLSFLAPYISTQLLDIPEIHVCLILAAILVFSNAISGIQLSILIGLCDFRMMSVLGVVNAILSISLEICGALAYGLLGALCGLAAAGLLGLAIVTMRNNKLLHKASLAGPAAERWWTEWRVVLGFSIPTVLLNLMTAPVAWICNVILMNGTDGHTNVAIYAVSLQWRNVVAFFPGIFSRMALPLLSRSHGQGDRRGFRQMLILNLASNAITGGTCAAVIAVFAGQILRLYGDLFLPGTSCVTLLALSGVVIGANKVMFQALASMGRMWLNFLLGLIASLFQVVLAVELAPRHGAVGVALAVLASGLLGFLLSSIALPRELKGAAGTDQVIRGQK